VRSSCDLPEWHALCLLAVAPKAPRSDPAKRFPKQRKAIEKQDRRPRMHGRCVVIGQWLRWRSRRADTAVGRKPDRAQVARDATNEGGPPRKADSVARQRRPRFAWINANLSFRSKPLASERLVRRWEANTHDALRHHSRHGGDRGLRFGLAHGI
jgi:hypothetical protein